METAKVSTALASCETNKIEASGPKRWKQMYRKGVEMYRERELKCYKGAELLVIMPSPIVKSAANNPSHGGRSAAGIELNASRLYLRGGEKGCTQLDHGGRLADWVRALTA